jgi:hypothetical protein
LEKLFITKANPELNMQAAAQLHTLPIVAMSNNSKHAAYTVTPPMASAHVPIHSNRMALYILRTTASLRTKGCRTSRRSRMQSVTTATSDYGSTWGDTVESYVVLVRQQSAHDLDAKTNLSQITQVGFDTLQGLAHCFEKDENGKLTDRYVIEPISASSLEVSKCLLVRLRW